MEIRLQNSTIFKDFKIRMAFENVLSPKRRMIDDINKGVLSDDLRMKIVVEGQSGTLCIDEICEKYGITNDIFDLWCKEFLISTKSSSKSSSVFKEAHHVEYLEDEKFKIVLEGTNGEFSIAEICRKYSIDQNEFLSWSRDFLQIRTKRLTREKSKDLHTQKARKLIVENSSIEALDYFESFVDVTRKDTCILTDDLIVNSHESSIGNLVGLKKINDVRHINKYFESINSVLSDNSIFIGCLETFSSRRKRKAINQIPIIGNLYFGFEFLFKRILPKLSLTKKYYFNFTKGEDRLLSKAEGLGRLVSCGFKIMDTKSISGLTYFIVKKCSEPLFDLSPSYGPIYAMPRIGKGGKIINVYKFRTMHPYSEYLQDYLIRANGYAKTGKPAEDFRIPVWAKFMRKYWLDELPQLINVLKGDMKFVGVRPVTKRYFEDIPREMQKLRLTQKPGCIPPYVSLNRESNVMSVLQAEREYLEDKIESPFLTDIKYFFRAIVNIIFHNKRSA